jgi:cysteine desulfurase
MNEYIYLDYQATTPTDSAVLEAMLPYFTQNFANPSSSHFLGIEASLVVERSRRIIAKTLGVKSKEILFTSGATESNNLAIKGIAESRKKGKIITVKTEHKCILNCCSELEIKGFNVVYLDVDEQGLISLHQLAEELTEDTILVSVMYGNNETGILQPIKEISKLTTAMNVPLHCDATQSIGVLKLNIEELGVNMLTFSSHKIYGPNGMGALYVENGIDISPIILGGGQEKGMRGGTSNVSGIVGMQTALTISHQKQEQEFTRLTLLREKFLKKLAKLAPICNTPIGMSLPHCLSLSFRNVNMQKALSRLNKVILSTGSACNSGDQKESHVLTAMGIEKSLANSTLRVSFGRNTNEADIDNAAEEIICAIEASYY